MDSGTDLRECIGAVIKEPSLSSELKQLAVSDGLDFRITQSQ